MFVEQNTSKNGSIISVKMYTKREQPNKFEILEQSCKVT